MIIRFPTIMSFVLNTPLCSGLKIHNEILNLNNQQNVSLYNLCKCYSIFLWEINSMTY